MKPITMIVINCVMPGSEGEYRRWCEPVLDAMRNEPMFINTILHQDVNDSTRFMLYETWADRDDFFGNQMKKPYRSDYERVLPTLLRAPREITFFDAIRADFNFHS